MPGRRAPRQCGRQFRPELHIKEYSSFSVFVERRAGAPQTANRGPCSGCGTTPPPNLSGLSIYRPGFARKFRKIHNRHPATPKTGIVSHFQRFIQARTRCPSPEARRYRIDLAGLLTGSRSEAFPIPKDQWPRYSERLRSFTAAGLFGTCTRFPFHSPPRMGSWKPNPGQR